MLLLTNEKRKERKKEKEFTIKKSQKVLTCEEQLFFRLISAGAEIENAFKQLNKDEHWALELLKSPLGIHYLASLQSLLDVEFDALYKDVIGCIKIGLGHSEPTVYLGAANLWLRTNKTKVKIELSAEDVVKGIIEEDND